MSKKGIQRFGYIFLLIAFVVVALFVFSDELARVSFRPTDSDIPVDVTREDSVESEISAVEIVSQNLSVPWGIAFLPEGGMLVTERTGTLLYIDDDGGEERIPVPGVRSVGEGGLLGIALHPEFETNRYLYLYLTTRAADGTINRVERYRFRTSRLSERMEIISGIPGAPYHDGGRISFGPDDKLYITTGDAGIPGLAQDPDSLAGKILRLNSDGSIPDDNPFESAVWSYGHRNPQGITFDDEGRMWSTEHGRSGIRSGLDELNLIEPGANYGWPIIQGDERREGMMAPVLHSGPNETWAPASALFWDGSIFWGGLRGESMYEAQMSGGRVFELERHFFSEFGRIRDIGLGPDGYFYITTSNTDGRGEVRPGDDKIIRINPSLFR